MLLGCGLSILLTLLVGLLVASCWFLFIHQSATESHKVRQPWVCWATSWLQNGFFMFFPWIATFSLARYGISSRSMAQNHKHRRSMLNIDQPATHRNAPPGWGRRQHLQRWMGKKAATGFSCFFFCGTIYHFYTSLLNVAIFPSWKPWRVHKFNYLSKMPYQYCSKVLLGDSGRCHLWCWGFSEDDEERGESMWVMLSHISVISIFRFLRLGAEVARNARTRHQAGVRIAKRKRRRSSAFFPPFQGLCMISLL